MIRATLYETIKIWFRVFTSCLKLSVFTICIKFSLSFEQAKKEIPAIWNISSIVEIFRVKIFTMHDCFLSFSAVWQIIVDGEKWQLQTVNKQILMI